MPVLIGWLINALRIMLMVKAGAIVAKILLFFGLAWGVDEFAVEPLLDQIRALISTGPGGGFGATVIQWAGVLRFDQAISMLLSAYGAAATIRTTKVGLGLAGAT